MVGVWLKYQRAAVARALGKSSSAERLGREQRRQEVAVVAVQKRLKGQIRALAVRSSSVVDGFEDVEERNRYLGDRLGGI